MTRSRFAVRLIGDSALYGLSASVAKALALLTVPYLTRALSPEGYGIADLATSTAALLTLVAMFSGDIPAARLYGLAAGPLERTRILSSFVWATVAVTAGLGTLALLAAPLVATYAWGLPDQTLMAVLAATLVPISGAQAALAQVQRIRARPRTFAAVAVVDLMAQLTLAVGLVALGAGPVGVIGGFVLGSIIGLIAAGLVGRDVLRVAPSWRVMRGVVAAGVPFLPHVVMFVFADWVARSILARTSGASEVAQLAVAIRVASVVTLVTSAFAMAWGPVALAREGSRDTARSFGRVLVAYGAALIVLASIIGMLGPELIRLISGPGYEDAALVLPGIAVAAAVAGTEYVLVVAAGVSDRGWRVAVSTTLGAAAQVVMCIVLVPVLGLLAIGPATMLGRIVSFSLLFAGVSKALEVPLWRLLVLGFGAIAAAALVHAMIAAGDAVLLARWLVAAILLAAGAAAMSVLIRSRAPQAA